MRDLYADIFSADEPAAVYDAVMGLYGFLEEKLSEDMPESERQSIACKKGCAYCCRVNVAVLPQEADCAAYYLKSNLSRAELEALIEKMRTQSMEISYIEDEDRAVMQKKCVFLNSEGACIIHPARPLLCRSVTSVSASDCEDYMVAQVFGNKGYVLMNLRQKELYEGVFVGLGEFAKERGRTAYSREVTPAVLNSLERIL